ncbi:MAG: recombinase family protein, partial [Dehalococcoidia bacterium]|nr:recombinase family protein [Dehalococcoidia bacterium]
MKKQKAPPVLKPGWAQYLRTSDEDAQAPERSQAGQARLIRDYLVEPSGLECLETYADTITGRSTDRENYQRLLKDAREGRFSHVAISHIDRFGRNDVEGQRAIDELVRLGIKVRVASSLTMEPEKPESRMIAGIFLSMARYESDRLSERTRMGMREKLYDGDWSWKAPDGYRNVEMRKSQLDLSERGKHARFKRSVETNPARHAMWRHAFDLLLTDRYTLDEIALKLHEEGYTLGGGAPFVTVLPDGRRHVNNTTPVSYTHLRAHETA